MTVDTSAEAVERLAAVFDRRAVLRAWAFAEPTEGMRELSLVAATLRALAQERDAARASNAKFYAIACRANEERDAARAEVERWKKAAREWDEYHPAYIEGGRAARRVALDEVERMRALLRRYRTETPLGHQPHMIAHEVDRALAEPQR